MSDALDDAALAVLERRIDEWLAAISAGRLPVEAIERGDGRRAALVRPHARRGQGLHDGVAHARPAHAALRDVRDAGAGGERRRRSTSSLLRRNERLVGAHFSIGIEDAVFLRGELPVVALTEAELDRVIGTLYATSSSASRRCSASASRAGSPDVPAFARRLRRHDSSGHVRVGANSGRSENLRAGPDAQRRAVPFAHDVATRLVIVGGGNMGAALLGGLLAADGADPAIARRGRGARGARATS